MKKKPISISNKLYIVAIFVGTIFGVVCGYMEINIFEIIGLSPQSIIVDILIFSEVFIGFLFGVVLHVVLHELGHLLFGKLSGYDFVSFRIDNIMFIKENNKLVRKKFNIVGTDGQCLMAPPEPINGKFPYLLYNLGGSFMNFIASGICFVIYILLSDSYPSLARIIFISVIFGLFLGLVNIIPMKIGGIANDGSNALILGKNEKARQAFWLQLHINALTTKGIRFRDMPAEWFDLPSDSDLNNVIVASVAMCGIYYLIDKQEFEKGKELTEYLLNTVDKMLEIHKNELLCDLLFLEIIGECRKEEIDLLYTKKLKKYINKTSSYVSRQRLLYAYARLVSNDNAESEKAHEQFIKCCITYPNAGEIASEKDLIDWIDNKYSNKLTHYEHMEI